MPQPRKHDRVGYIRTAHKICVFLCMWHGSQSLFLPIFALTEFDAGNFSIYQPVNASAPSPVDHNSCLKATSRPFKTVPGKGLLRP